MKHSDFFPKFRIALRAAAILQPNTGRSGGILETKKIAAMAEAAQIEIAPHCYCGPLVAAANRAAFAAGHAFGETCELFDHPYAVRPAERPAGTYTNITGNVAMAWGLVAAGQHSGRLTARPPWLVSLYLDCMSRPVSRMVLITASRETWWVPSPFRASEAALMAFTAASTHL